MSLDVYLRLAAGAHPIGERIFIRENGRTAELTRAEWDARYPDREPFVVTTSDGSEVFSANITHNLAPMARDAGIYKVLWRPDENDITHAEQLIQPLRDGLALLRSDPARFKAFNPSNGWGDYEGLIGFVEEYLAACEQYPTAEVSAWR